MKEVKLTNSANKALVDDDDYDFITSNYSWYESGGYAATHPTRGSPKRMHEVIADRYLWKRLEIHHVDENGLNNQKANLVKMESRPEHMHTRGPSKTKTYKGVYFDKRYGKFFAYIKINGKGRGVSYFKTAEEAARAYDDLVRRFRGPTAFTNFA